MLFTLKLCDCTKEKVCSLAWKCFYSNNAFAIASSSSEQDCIICLCQLYQTANWEYSSISKIKVVEELE